MASSNNTARQALVPANELLLLAQETKAMKKCFNPDQTLGNYVTSFNVDTPPSAARQRQLDGVLAAEERRQAEVLKEGNSLAFFDIKVVEKQIDESSEERSEATFAPKKSPAFQILQSARSLFAIREAAERFQESTGVTNLKYFALPLKTTARCTFAVASVVLSKLEAAHAQYEEPFVAVHALFSSEMEAVTFAMNIKASQLVNSAMLCIFPVGKWIYLEHAHDWFVQVEANKREKRAPSLTGVSSTTSSPTRSRRLSLVVEPPKPIWEQERDDARRLHNFICARMGAPMPDKKKDRTEENGGFTPQPLVSLEDKLDTLHSYLQATAAFTARTGYGGVAMLKYRQVKRFGSIMRSRISGTQPHGNGNSSRSGNSPPPRTSFSHVIPG
ncbi:hypothetical protein PHYSODRAFT_262292 [Phytophthora sojae]|uniref:Uncharacterized protein n=1 Tax=Phytophthora sojae (strain P6497) TaxID=1094619 RepID=G5AII2_PHYSP|nr:hypothetical protein PHYSODRAFT_262292 [Phytophthora sojae]EGZ04683.1 hypothetical protein PHYSODRAFT_262292 [Phytophthora sojae]|eukprot:XP_009539883.1 hypothetical protein PHYSODRAFT_262292 [Phytophthora sojae]